MVHRLPQVFDWIDLPIFGADGWPRRCAVSCPMLEAVFCGLAFQYAFSSTVLAGLRMPPMSQSRSKSGRRVPRARSLSLVARNL